jgi:hypothetical protein
MIRFGRLALAAENDALDSFPIDYEIPQSGEDIPPAIW